MLAPTTSPPLHAPVRIARIVGIITNATEREFLAALADVGEGDELRIDIDSPGGSCPAAFNMLAALRKCPAKRTVTVAMGRAFSTAAALFLAGHERVMTVGSALMLHNASANGDETHAMARAYSEQLADQFVERMPTVARATIREWQARSTVFDHADCLRLGLATAIDTTQAVQTRVSTRGCHRPE